MASIHRSSLTGKGVSVCDFCQYADISNCWHWQYREIAWGSTGPNLRNFHAKMSCFTVWCLFGRYILPNLYAIPVLYSVKLGSTCPSPQKDGSSPIIIFCSPCRNLSLVVSSFIQIQSLFSLCTFWLWEMRIRLSERFCFCNYCTET